MATEDIRKLSPEQLQKLSKTINEAKALTNQQADIIEQVIAGEIDIGKLRISYLTEYFDTYSKSLDLIARKHNTLNDAFLILDQKINDSFKKVTTDTAKAISDIDEAADKAIAKTSNKNAATGTNNSGTGIDNTLQEILALSRENANNIARSYYTKANDGQRTFDSERYGGAVPPSSTWRGSNGGEGQAQPYTTLTETQKSGMLNAETAAVAELKAAISELLGQNLPSVNGQSAEAQQLNNINAAAEERALAELRTRLEKERTELEFQARLENDDKLAEAEMRRINEMLAEKYANEQEWIEKIRAEQLKEDEKQSKKRLATMQQEQISVLANARSTWAEKKEAFKNLTSDESGHRDSDKTSGVLLATAVKALDGSTKALSDLTKKLDGTIRQIASYQSTIDTRLQGSSNETRDGSYWEQLSRDMTSLGAINPYFKQETFANNIKDLVNIGIAFDLEQRAFLMTIQEKIATTFNVADGTLLRLIRIQQEDSTAGRLGMEASLNAFLNEMYETTEYLSDVAASVRGSLEEMESLMTGAEATEVEYQVQKWLGSLYSVGMSQSAVNSISQALGQIASGQIDGLTNGGGAGNLLVMAANDAGLSIADVLTSGLDASDTNKLMQSVVKYLAEIAESSKDNNVVQQQLANVFGVKASDLRAATNLAAKGSVSSIYEKYESYDTLLNKLFTMAGSIGDRTSTAEMLTNIWENGQYTIAGGIANSPAAYLIYKAASLLDSAVGGIPIPDISVMGNSVALNTTVADLMRVAAVGGGILSSIGPIMSGLGNSFSGQSMLAQLGITPDSGLSATPRGGNSGGNIGAAGGTVSESGYFAGNASGSDILNSTIQESKNTKEQLMVEAKEENATTQIDMINTTVLKIYELLEDVTHGGGSLRVRVEGYGLTKAGNSSTTLGGVNALVAGSSTMLGSEYSSSVSSLNSQSGLINSLDFGGWTTTV